MVLTQKEAEREKERIRKRAEDIDSAQIRSRVSAKARRKSAKGFKKGRGGTHKSVWTVRG
jgi:hypothetical protein